MATFFPLLVAVLYWPIWQGKAGIGWDLIESYWPDLAFFAHQLGRGDFPLWNPYERGGYPAHADPQPGLFYPLNWLLALAGALGGETSWWLGQIKDLLHHALAGAMMHLFLRSRGLPLVAALYGGAAVLLAGTWMGEKSNNFLHALAWVPLVWLATDALLAKPTWRRACGLAAALYLPASVGSPPGYFYALLMALGYGAFRVLPWLVQTILRQRQDAVRPILRLLGTVALAAVLTAATQLLLFAPGLELTAFSSRASRGLAYALHGEMGMVHTLIGIVSPANGTAHSYLGLGTLVLVLVALVARPRRDGAAPVFFVVLGAFFLVLSFGGQTPVLTWLVQHLPGFGLFRACGRYRVLFGMCLAATSAYGLAYLLEIRAKRPLRPTLLVSGALALVTVLLLWLRTYPLTYPAQLPPPARSFLVLAVAAGLLLAVALVPPRFSRIPAGLAIGLLLADPNGFMHHRGHGFWARLDHEALAQYVEKLPGLPGYRVFDEFALEERSGSRRLLRELRGYSATDPLSTVAWQNICLTAGAAPQILGEFNVRYLLHAPHPHKGFGCCHFVKLPPDALAPTRFKPLAPGIYELSFPAPWVAWYGGLQVVAPGQELAALLGARSPDGQRQVAVVLADELERAGLSAAARPLVDAAARAALPPARAGRVKRFDSERVELEIDAPAAGVVVLNEANYPGWRVSVDGKDTPSFTVDTTLRAVLVEPGKHRVVWRYTPRRWGLYASLWWAGMLAFALAVWAAARDRKRRSASDQPPASAATPTER